MFDRTACLEAARDVASLSHSPYCADSVIGVAIQSDVGIHRGCSLNNCAYPNSICGVRAGFVNALSEGASRIDGVAVVGTSPSRKPYICGSCRETVAEFGNFPIVIASKDIAKFEETRIEKLLPGIDFARAFVTGRKFELAEADVAGYAPEATVAASTEHLALYDAAIKACHNAYIPVSKFPVGAAVLTDKGVFTGSNIEHKVIGQTLCAERTALCKAVAGGARKFKCIAVCCYKMDEFSSPCGGCRQSLVEFGDFPVHLLRLNRSNKTFDVKVTSSFEILPDCFSPASLS